MNRNGRRAAPLIWVMGVVLLRRSRARTTRDKLIGTRVVPGGLACVVYVAVDAALLVTEGCEPEDLCSVAIYIDPVWGVVLTAMAVLPLASAIDPRSARTSPGPAEHLDPRQRCGPR